MTGNNELNTNFPIVCCWIAQFNDLSYSFIVSQNFLRRNLKNLSLKCPSVQLEWVIITIVIISYLLFQVMKFSSSFKWFVHWNHLFSYEIICSPMKSFVLSMKNTLFYKGICFFFEWFVHWFWSDWFWSNNL